MSRTGPRFVTTSECKRVPGAGCELVWRPDGLVVEKRYHARSWWFLDHCHRPYDREARVGKLLNRERPPFAIARLVGSDHRRRVLAFEAVDGEVLGPKYPFALPDDDLEDLIQLGRQLATYAPRARFLPRFDLVRRINRAVTYKVLDKPTAALFQSICESDPPDLRFAHGDLTARNVLRAVDGRLVLIDWEWAGCYPPGWDLAFLWFSLIELPAARARVVASVPAKDIDWFWRSALLIQTLHLAMFEARGGSVFRDRHRRALGELAERVLAQAGP